MTYQPGIILQQQFNPNILVHQSQGHSGYTHVVSGVHPMPQRRHKHSNCYAELLQRKPLVDVRRQPILNSYIPVLHCFPHRRSKVGLIGIQAVDGFITVFELLQLLGFGTGIKFFVNNPRLYRRSNLQFFQHF